MGHTAVSPRIAGFLLAALFVGVSLLSVGAAATTDVQTSAKQLDANPKDVPARIALIQVDIDAESYAGAEKLADDGVKLVPTAASLWAARGAAYFNDGVSRRSAGNSGMEELQVAADSYAQALKLDPQSAPGTVASAAFAQYGLALWQTQRYSDCLVYADKATSVNPKAWQYKMLKGDCESGLQNYKAAIADYTLAQQSDDNANAMISSRLSAALGNAQLRAGDEAAGLQSMSKAESLDPSAPYAYQTLFAYYTSKDPPQLSKALDALGHLAQLQPNDPRVQNEIGNLYLRQGSYELASAAFTKTLQIDPKNADAQFGLAEVAATQGDSKTADSALQKAIAASPSDASFYYASAAQLLVTLPTPTNQTHTNTVTTPGGSTAWTATPDRVIQAQTYADAATRADPNDGTAWYWLGVVYAQEGKKDLAGGSLRKASQIFSSKSCVDVHFVDRAAPGASCLEYQKMMLAQVNSAFANLNDNNATLMGTNGMGGGTGKDIRTNGDMPH